jgi:ankyrin repeat protein
VSSNPNETDARGWAPLLYAVVAGDTVTVDALIRAGAHVDAAAPDGATPLMKAALWGHTDIVKALITAGADPRKRDRDDWSALDLAEAGHYTETAELLRQACSAKGCSS